MLVLLYPSLDPKAIEAIYRSNENKNLAERLRETKEVLDQIKIRKYFEEAKQGTDASEKQTPANTDQEAQDATSEDKDSDSTQQSWFRSFKDRLSKWGKTESTPAQSDSQPSSQTDEEIKEAQTWSAYFKSYIPSHPIPPIQVTNNSDHNIALCTCGPLDAHIPVKTIANIIRMIQEGTIKLTRIDKNGATGSIVERLGPGCVMCLSATQPRDGDVFSGDGWFRVAMKMTWGLSESKYEYPKDFTIVRFPMHVITAVPTIGPFLYEIFKYLVE